METQNKETNTRVSLQAPQGCPWTSVPGNLESGMVAKGQDDQRQAGRKDSLQGGAQIPRQEQEGRGVRTPAGVSESNQEPG